MGWLREVLGTAVGIVFFAFMSIFLLAAAALVLYIVVALLVSFFAAVFGS
jgi:hypothetical protein